MNTTYFYIRPEIRTDQDAFDATVRYLSGKRNGRAYVPTPFSKDGEGQCLYYIPETEDRCAIGHLIQANSPAELAVLAQIKSSVSGFMLGVGVDGIPGNEAFLRAHNLTTDLLTHLQTAHDEGTHWTNDRFNGYGFRELRTIAIKYRMSTLVLEDAILNRLNEALQ